MLLKQEPHHAYTVDKLPVASCSSCTLTLLVDTTSFPSEDSDWVMRYIKWLKKTYFGAPEGRSVNFWRLEISAILLPNKFYVQLCESISCCPLPHCIQTTELYVIPLLCHEFFYVMVLGWRDTKKKK